MAQLVVSEFVSVDRVFEDPGGAEGFEHGGGTFKFDRGPEGDKFKADELIAADALRSAASPTTGSPRPGRRWRKRPADAMGEVARLKRELSGDVLVAGSGQLVRALTAAGLVDEYRLMLFPIVLGTGKRLFDGTDAPGQPALGQHSGGRRQPDPDLRSAMTSEVIAASRPQRVG